MKTQNLTLVSLAILLACSSCKVQPEKKSLEFKDYPNLKLGFSTQNFQAAMANNVANLTEIIEYASTEGYQFIELRDPLAKLTEEECMKLAEVAKEKKIDVIYEIHKNLLDTGYFEVFKKGLANAKIFNGPGIIRTVVSGSEFKDDPSKKGWTKEEFQQLTRIADSCTLIAKGENIRFIVENFDEAFFGDGTNYFGISDFFNSASGTGFQLDMSNMFRKPAREMTEPDKVLQYLPTLGDQWVTTHLKTVLTMGGDMQPTLTENPLPVEKIVGLMGKQNVIWAAFELASVPDKQQCFANHASSVQFLKDKGLLK
jgi:sugar phosphate isomerase/epimerase